MFNVGMDISKEVKKVMISLWATPEVKVKCRFFYILIDSIFAEVEELKKVSF